MISAKIIADSKNAQGQRLTTFVLTFPRIVLAEFNTHRMFSRNSASSRAIPFKKMVEMVKNNPFIPIRWMKEHTGMQGSEYFDECDHETLRIEWLRARDAAVESATILSNLGLSKQFVNRLLEPFMWHTVIITASDYENFFALRAHDAAEIHIQDLAFKMLEEYNKSTPAELKEGEWHIPFGDQIDIDRLIDALPLNSDKEFKDVVIDYRLKIATARCARVSYGTFEGKDDYEADIKLHDRLASSGHWSPFEHCAKAMNDWNYSGGLSDTRFLGGDESGNAIYEQGWCGNFRGFIQYRKTFQNENKSDNRVKK